MSENQVLEGGAYEVIRARLDKSSAALSERLQQLNEDRQAVFGAIETTLVSTERVTTEHNCVPRDIVPVGENRFLFGYNIHFGLKATTDVKDVFAAYSYDPEEHVFHHIPEEEVLVDPAFAEDFQYLYRYYKNTTFAKFMVIGPCLYMAMRTGKSISDIKTFKWRITGDGTLEYLGNRFDHEYQFPPQQEFEWIRAHRDMQRQGEHPHISIEDRVFVETVGGDLTIKIEDNTEDGEGIYSEPVDDADQSLDDAEFFYASLGHLIILKILPYREDLYRYLVYNEKTHEVHRVDGIGDSCVLLPDDQGLIFSNGYLLLTGEAKFFDTNLADMRFERRIASANGEDILYVFYNRQSGDYVLMAYNMIAQTVETPIICNGYTLFPNGELIYFKTEDDPQRHHTLQVWQTPIQSEEAVALSSGNADSFLYKIGNPDLVRGMAECREVLALLRKDDSYGGLYFDLTKSTTDILDSYYWIAKEETQNLAEPLRDIQKAASSAIEEFEKVQTLRKTTRERTVEVQTDVTALLREIRTSAPDDILGFVRHLSELRTQRGHAISLRDFRYHDEELIAGLESQLTEAYEVTAEKTVAFLLSENALQPYAQAVTAQQERIEQLTKVSDADDVREALDQAGADLEMLIEVVSNLKIDDATQTTQIIDNVSGIYATLNSVRAELKTKRLKLFKGESSAQYAAQIKLLSQATVNYLDLCDTPEKCTEYLTKLMVQLEELEGRFSEFDDYLEQLATKREEIYEAFEGRKQNLLETRNRRASTLQKSADRILSGIANRLSTFTEITEINGYIAGDLMIEKLRDIIAELTELGDPVKADGIQTRLNTTRDDAVRALKDRNELFVDGQAILQFGRHKFSVNEQELELSIVPQEDEMCFHLSGTAYFEPITDERFLSTQHVWTQTLISENDQVSRAEYLAYRFLTRDGFQASTESAEWSAEGGWLPAVQAYMQPRYAEGYVKGVHDLDAVALLDQLIPMYHEAGLLKYSPQDRATALALWPSISEELKTRLRNLCSIRKFAPEVDEPALRVELEQVCGDHPRTVAHYLYDQFTTSEHPVVSSEAAQIYREFQTELSAKRAKKEFEEGLERIGEEISGRSSIALNWIRAMLPDRAASAYLYEVAFLVARGGYEPSWVQEVVLDATVTGLKSLNAEEYQLNFNEFLDRLEHFSTHDVPTYQSYLDLKVALVEEKKAELRLDEFKPRVMSAFVRNRLINEVYLPLVGDNLAKQIGTAGKNTRTDRMGLLLLISPPGYGKTTLMEYIANRLGLTFVKINGPAIGHEVTSLDPSEAPNASAREEVEKLNLALEMGDNIMLYLDDIQHTNPELLQKFISLCDGQRKIEGVFKGQAKTYDLRGKKVAVVMAGNPYTETGGKFQIPDMLANRADTYNLGEIIGESEGAFAASFVENALTSNPVLSKLSSQSQSDLYALMQAAQDGTTDGIDLEGNYSPAEIEEYVTTLQHLSRVRDTIMRVNAEYVRSAAQEDAYRTEPAFKLQGSYRNMNRMAEKVLPLMTDEEVVSLIHDHYQNESQTLTTGAVANLLKFHDMEDSLSGEQSARWEGIKTDFAKQKLLGGGENDPVTRIVGQLTALNDTIERGASAQPPALNEQTIAQLERIIAGLRAVPVEVDIKVVPVEQDGETPRELPPGQEPKIAQESEVRQNPS